MSESDESSSSSSSVWTEFIAFAKGISLACSFFFGVYVLQRSSGIPFSEDSDSEEARESNESRGLFRSCVRVGTRTSALALAQTHEAVALLRASRPDIDFEIVRLSTAADTTHAETPMQQLGGDGMFIKELENALLDNRVDISVHSLKDMPTKIPVDLVLQGVLAREETSDALVARIDSGSSPDDVGSSLRGYSGHGTEFIARLPPGTRIGSSSNRRKAQLLALNPNLVIEGVRGNVNTRLRKLDEGMYDYLILACAGLRRLGLEKRISLPLDMMHAVGQAAIGLECRSNDFEVRSLISSVTHSLTWAHVRAERALLSRLNGGCMVPIAVKTNRDDTDDKYFTIQSAVLSEDGSDYVFSEYRGLYEQCEEVGRTLAEILLEKGGDQILKTLRH